MIHRTALFAATLAATVALAFGLALAGFNPGAGQPAADPVVASVDPAPQPTVQVDTVYLTPPVAPQNVTVTRTQQGGEGENEHEGRDD
jgi:hypothetical protein